ncbi:MAG TPA: PP2C family serine/threonine-protein phosphatase [Mycobacteriales bacterium]|nr:PP2C family serine/threonine-protein phosphatase [Mycobacteriales bacterium]
MTVEATAAACPRCASPLVPEDQFCESCGAPVGVAPVPAAGAAAAEELPAGLDSARTRLIIPAPSEPGQDPAPVRHCASCAGLVDETGYCTVCGVKAAAERDHFRETPSGWTGGVCDRGRRHHRNEDAMASAADDEPGSFAALVVCDGVSSSPDSDRASLAAARAARDVLAAAHAERPADPVAYWTEALGRAGEAAQAEARAAFVGEGTDSPSCTFVATVLAGPVLVTGNVGDSRAYWLPDEGPAVQLTEDDSWVTEQVRQGVPREVAETDHRAHAITRWLGADSPDPVPRCVATTATGPGWLLVCSDGLWNYCSPAADLRDLVRERAAADATPTAVAAALVDFANAAGGQDNVTVVLARVPAAVPPSD